MLGYDAPAYEKKEAREPTNPEVLFIATRKTDRL